VLKKEDVNIELHDNPLKISGETKMASGRDGKGCAVRLRSYGTFERDLHLPEAVKAEKIKANMENGVLSVYFLKTVAKRAPD